jgi:ABC-2 type transport system permease protein
MVGVLVEMRTAILRRNARGKRAIGTVLLVLFVLVVALVSLLTGLVHYCYPGAGANVLATLNFG